MSLVVICYSHYGLVLTCMKLFPAQHKCQRTGTERDVGPVG
jgi:hypothetical protein